MAERRFEPLRIEEIISDLENFRHLRSHCAHDLRSKLGAAVGILQLLAEDPALQELHANPMFKLAASAATEALDEMDQILAQVQQGFDVVWILAGGGTHLHVTREKERCLFVHFESEGELAASIGRYQPVAMVVDEARVQGDLAALLRKLGPQMVRMYVACRDPQVSLKGIPSGVVHQLAMPIDWKYVEKDLNQWLAQRREAREKL